MVLTKLVQLSDQFKVDLFLPSDKSRGTVYKKSSVVKWDIISKWVTLVVKH